MIAARLSERDGSKRRWSSTQKEALRYTECHFPLVAPGMHALMGGRETFVSGRLTFRGEETSTLSAFKLSFCALNLIKL